MQLVVSKARIEFSQHIKQEFIKSLLCARLWSYKVKAVPGKINNMFTNVYKIYKTYKVISGRRH